MMVAAALVIPFILLGIRRSKSAVGYVDPFHPLIFPLSYVAFSFLVPVWFSIILDRPVGSLARDVALSPGTAGLLILGIAGFALGAAVPFAGSKRGGTAPPSKAFGEAVITLGRLLMLVPLALMARGAATGAVVTRGVDQAEVTVIDTLHALLAPVTLASAVLLIAGHRTAQSEKLLRPVDWALLAVAAVLSAANGERGDVITLVLIVAVALTLRRRSMRPFLIAVGIIVVVAVGVLSYRSTAAGVTAAEERRVTDILLGDMAVAGFTTGATAAVVPKFYEYSDGRTLREAVIRQLPSPIAIPLFGPPNEAGARYFRTIIQLSDRNSGVGFSLPAEGYLNFGRPGIFAICGLLGMLMSWAYPRTDLRQGRAVGLLYPVLVATLPFGLRSDVLGGIKSVLYPFLIAAIVMVIARTVERNESGGRHSRPAVPRVAPERSLAR